MDEVAYDPAGARPGGELVVSRPLGDGSVAVCDLDLPRDLPAQVPNRAELDPLLTAVARASIYGGCMGGGGTPIDGNQG